MKYNYCVQKKLPNILLISVVIIGILTIIGSGTNKNYKIMLNTWNGVHVDNLIASWGPPQSSYTLSDGGKVIEYVRQRTVQTGGYTIPKKTTDIGMVLGEIYIVEKETYIEVPVQTDERYCRTRFRISPHGIIIAGSFEGNDCRARP